MDETRQNAESKSKLHAQLHFQLKTPAPSKTRSRFSLRGAILSAICCVVLVAGLWSSARWLMLSPQSLDHTTDSKGTQSAVQPKASDAEQGFQSSSSSHPLDPVLALARSSLAVHRSEHRDYRARVVKQERSGKKLAAVSVMEVKLRYREPPSEATTRPVRPVDVYLKFIEPKSQAGREVIWRQNMNDNLMMVHEAGILNITTVELAPDSRLAMLGNRYPISDLGLEKLLEKLIERGLQDRSFEGCEVSIDEKVVVADRECKRIEVLHPKQEIAVDGVTHRFDFHRAIIDIDLQWGIPIHYASYLWPEQPDGEPVLDEEFTYENLELNVGFSDEDFDPNNPSYDYP